MGTRVALYGGSFNPPHVGHVLAVAYVLSIGAVDRVLVVPVFEHSLGKQLVPFEHRIEMARLAFGWLPRVEVSALERDLGAPSRTLKTILALQASHPDWELRLMVGSDILAEIHQWHAFAEIERRAPLLVLGRAGFESAGAPESLLPRISSSEVRELFSRAAAGDDAALRACIPSAVLEYAERHALYRPRA